MKISLNSKESRADRFISPAGTLSFTSLPLSFSFSTEGLSKLQKAMKKNNYTSPKIDLSSFPDAGVSILDEGKKIVGRVVTKVVGSNKQFSVLLNRGTKW